MTRILAFGDTQIGVATVTLAEQQKVLERIVQTALDHGVDLVLHGGDVFEGPVVTPEHLRMFIDAVRPLRDADIPLVVIRGNGRHDLATRSVHALDVLREVDGITVSDRPELFHTHGVRICTLPWVHPGRVLAATNGEFSHDRVSEDLAETLVGIAADLYARTQQMEVKDIPTVLLAHWAISGAKLPTGLPVDQLREPVLSWPDLDVIGFDAIIGAHVHESQVLHDVAVDRTPGIVVGSPQQLNHGEHGDHGCWLIELGALAVTSKPFLHAESFQYKGWCGKEGRFDFIPIESQRFVTLDLEDATVEQEFPVADLEGAIVRVRYTATEEDARRVDHTKMRAELLDAGAAKVTIEPKIERSVRARSEAITDQLGPLDALDAYCDAQQVEDAMRGRMRETLAEWMTT